MITTLPGLYLVSAALLAPIATLLRVGVEEVCTTLTLRGINLAFMIANFGLLYLLSRKIHIQDKKRGLAGTELPHALNATALCIFPVLFFFSFLYYTDPGAVFWVLLMYLVSLEHTHKTAAMCGVIAVLFRQTNIIWVVFTAGAAVEKDWLSWIRSDRKSSAKQVDTNGWPVILVFVSQILNCVRHHPKRLGNLVLGTLKTVYPYIAVAVMFVLFVFVNGGIVVGDRSHHQSCLNFPQLFYFLLACLGFACAHMISPPKIKFFFQYIISRPINVGIFLAVSTFLIANFTLVHEYLLADNRHYPFYLWSKLYRRHEYIKFLLLPVYGYAMWAFYFLLSHKSAFWKLFFFVCLVLLLVPQKLLEFRYFITPFYIFRLNIQLPSKLLMVLEMALYVAINVATVYIYVFRPFKWNDSDALQRFMW